jgi:D-alanyl-D-alanine carboxypeptidase
MPSVSRCNSPLRGNGAHYECFLRAARSRCGRPTATLTVHRKSDGAELARGTLQLGSRLRLVLCVARPGIPSSSILGELRLLLGRRFPRRVLTAAVGASRRPARGRPLRGSCDRGKRAGPGRPDPAARKLDAVRSEVPNDYGAARQLPPQREPLWLELAGRDHAGRECWLLPEARRAWHRLDAAAREDGVSLVLVSGFRSADYQARILLAKRARGQAMSAILAVNAAPGYSEHHSGRAVDLTSPGCAPAEPEFETTAAYRWLVRHAGEFGFRMSYPAGNPHGIVPEPWHWFHIGARL